MKDVLNMTIGDNYTGNVSVSVFDMQGILHIQWKYFIETDGILIMDETGLFQWERVINRYLEDMTFDMAEVFSMRRISQAYQTKNEDGYNVIYSFDLPVFAGETKLIVKIPVETSLPATPLVILCKTKIGIGS